MVSSTHNRGRFNLSNNLTVYKAARVLSQKHRFNFLDFVAWLDENEVNVFIVGAWQL